MISWNRKGNPSSRAVRIKHTSDDGLPDDEVKFLALEFWRQHEPAPVKLSQSSLAWETFKTISNGNRTEWSPIRSAILWLTKSDDRKAGVRFVNQEYDYGQNWTTRSPITN